jgi:hypothetical protein
LKKYEDVDDKPKPLAKNTFNPFAAVSKRTCTVLLFLWFLILIVDGLKHYFVNY